MKALLLAFIMSLNIAIATLGVFLAVNQFLPVSFIKCATIAICFIMLSYVPSGAGFSVDRALAMAIERLGFSSTCFSVLLVINFWAR